MKSFEEIPQTTLEIENKILPSNIDEALSQSDFKIVEGLNPPRTYIVKIEHPEGAFKGVFKDYASEIESANHEKAAYIVDKALGFDLVLPMAMRDLEDKRGILIPFIEQITNPIEAQIQDDELKEDFFKIGIFDFLIGEVGRDNKKNILIKNKKIFAIDHEFSFFKPPYTKFQKKAFNQPFPDELRNKIIEFYKNKENINLLKSRLNELLEKRYVKDFFWRLEIITECAKINRFLSEEDYKKILDKYRNYKLLTKP